MDTIHKLLNFVAPPLALVALCLTLPLLYICKIISYILRSISTEDLTGKVVIITGASSGIGEHLAYEYGRRGARLVLVARRENSLREVAKKAGQLGSPDVLVVRADVSKVEDCKRFIQEAVNHFGRIDHLICNAGITCACIFEDALDVTNFRTVMDINFWGSIYSTYFAIPHLRKSKGKIIVISSSAGSFVSPMMSLYGASKAAMINFYETLRVELGQEVKVTLVTPGFVESEMTQGKHLSKGGSLEVDAELRDVAIGAVPVLSVSECTKSIVNGACRGDRYVTEPSWFGLLFVFQFCCPELVEWFCRMLYGTKPGASNRETLSRKLLDVVGAKKFFYPSSIHSSQIKKD
ncbi:PREDICTED: 11-beta-hydroxysteroid dehydrogenase 1B-like [Nelumbo nucifera]|uniref:11-beta-hydroxysteroid dehydrogenase 1B-like n=2 Tax=Nelumbo nucifera TaxID=4432 RepID=A0A822YQ09_NELNU|nr:PREDICTED: 11-beta-hydroxysteroid dehydrogenase 1B-like [Nelumbo nucifera]DAD34183.1 TPA_asm: hypothetical protein HUJ06_004823 [Nelumbo nucifera]